MNIEKLSRRTAFALVGAAMAVATVVTPTPALAAGPGQDAVQCLVFDNVGSCIKYIWETRDTNFFYRVFNPTPAR